MNIDELRNRYFDMFNEMPRVNIIAGYDNIFVQLVQNALKTHKVITKEMFDNAYKNEILDVDNSDNKFSNFGK